MFNRDGEQATGHSSSSSSFPWTSSGEAVPPRWKDRFFSDHKSRDQVIQQLRDELDRQRKMFFERAAHPQWNSVEHRGFPFGETAKRFADRAGFPQFDDDAEVWVEEGGRQRHPSGGSCRTTSSKSSTGSGASNHSSGGEDPPCSTHSPKFRKAATRSATGEFPIPSAAPRGFRASSAPPPPTSSSSPRRFTTTMKVPINEPAPAKEQPPPPPSQQQHQQHAHCNVRQIPIFVEGRDEPVLAKLEEEDRSQDSDTDKPDAVDHTKPIPMPFHESQDAQSAKPIPLPFHSDEPIPLPFHQESSTSSNTAAVEKEPSSRAAPANCPETEAQVSMSQIDSIRREAELLMPRIEAFKGSRGDREFLFLDEMLTRLLLKLDLIPVEGRDDVRQTRKEAIGSIQRCINLLESKCCSPAATVTQDPGECDPGPSQVKDNSDTSEASSSEPIALGYSHI